MKCLAACFSACALMLSSAHAEEYPYRNPSYYRTVFIESAVSKCLRDENSTAEIVRIYCGCKATQVAAFLTQKNLDEMAEGGIHVTKTYWDLADKADRVCYKVLTGKELN